MKFRISKRNEDLLSSLGRPSGYDGCYPVHLIYRRSIFPNPDVAASVVSKRDNLIIGRAVMCGLFPSRFFRWSDFGLYKKCCSLGTSLVNLEKRGVVKLINEIIL